MALFLCPTGPPGRLEIKAAPNVVRKNDNEMVMQRTPGLPLAYCDVLQNMVPQEVCCVAIEPPLRLFPVSDVFAKGQGMEPDALQSVSLDDVLQIQEQSLRLFCSGVPPRRRGNGLRCFKETRKGDRLAGHPSLVDLLSFPVVNTRR